jgi:hypothetical protein
MAPRDRMRQGPHYVLIGSRGDQVYGRRLVAGGSRLWTTDTILAKSTHDMTDRDVGDASRGC